MNSFTFSCALQHFVERSESFPTILGSMSDLLVVERKILGGSHVVILHRPTITTEACLRCSKFNDTRKFHENRLSESHTCDIHLCDLERRLFNGMREFHENRLSKSHECGMLDPGCVRSATSH